MEILRQRCLDPDPFLKNSWIRIQFVLTGWIRIQSISDRIRNPSDSAIELICYELFLRLTIV